MSTPKALPVTVTALVVVLWSWAIVLCLLGANQTAWALAGLVISVAALATLYHYVTE